MDNDPQPRAILDRRFAPAGHMDGCVCGICLIFNTVRAATKALYPEARIPEPDKALTDFGKELAAKQEPLGREFAEVLAANLPDLYVRSEPHPEARIPETPMPYDPHRLSERERASLQRAAPELYAQLEDAKVTLEEAAKVLAHALPSFANNIVNQCAIRCGDVLAKARGETL